MEQVRDLKDELFLISAALQDVVCFPTRLLGLVFSSSGWSSHSFAPAIAAGTAAARQGHCDTTSRQPDSQLQETLRCDRRSRLQPV